MRPTSGRATNSLPSPFCAPRGVFNGTNLRTRLAERLHVRARWAIHYPGLLESYNRR